MPIHFTLIESNTGIITKVISKQADGSVLSDGSMCRVVRGKAYRRSVEDEVEFAVLIGGMPSHVTLVSGQLRPDLPDVVDVVPAAALQDSTILSTAIARTREFMHYAVGVPAVLVLDDDFKHVTPAVRAALEAYAAGEPRITDDPRFALAATVLAALNKRFPGLASAGVVIRLSTSAGIVDTETGLPCPGTDNCHIYITVVDGTDSQRALRSIHDWLFLIGLSWIDLGSAGQYLERSIIDRSVGGPEHLVFEGTPTVLAPLQQDPHQRTPLAIPGVAIDTRALIPPCIRDSDLAELNRVKAQQKAALTARRASIQDAYRARQVTTMIARGVPEAVAQRSVERALTDAMPMLDPYQVLQFDDPELGDVPVADVLQDSQRYKGQTLADPFEGIAYGRCKAMVMVKREGGLFINSFAHGGMRYDLKYDAEHLRQALDAINVAHRAEAYARLSLLADLSAIELERLRQDTNKACGNIGLRKLDALRKAAILESARIRREAAAEEHKQERQARGDLRAEHMVPDLNGEISAVMDVINDSMRPFLDASVPPMRREGTGALVRLSESIPEALQTLSQVHQMTSVTVNTVMDESSLPRLPPVGHTRLTPLQEVELPEYLESYVRFHDQYGSMVRLPAPYVRPFLVRPFDSHLPIAKGVITSPLVLPDGELIVGQCFDRRLGLLVRTPPELTPYLPSIAECTPQAVADAVKFLCQDFLVDVTTDLSGKALTIALMVTIIERALLPARPGFMVTAGQQAAGKTTLLHAVSMAVLGHYANAIPYSTSEEERRKRMMAGLSAGHPLMAWDNIRAGSVISCQKIGLAMTSPTYNDRILGESFESSVPATTIQAFTGNNISAGGELASRILLIRLLTRLLYPDNRSYAHPRFMDWIQRHRVEILRALYVILLGNFHERTPDPAVSATRFPEWYYLVGGAVERAIEQYLHYHGSAEERQGGGLSFGALLLKQRDESAITDGLSALHQFIAQQRHPDGRLWRDAFAMAEVAAFIEQHTPNAIELNHLLASVSGLPVLSRASSKHIEARFRAIKDTPSNIYTQDGRSESVRIEHYETARNTHTYRLQAL
jgi:hypothetical protein